MYTVYILKSISTSFYYIGSTNNIDRRLLEHNSGKSKSTKYRRPFVVIYKEEYLDKLSAVKRELQIKSYKGGNAFKKLIEEPYIW